MKWKRKQSFYKKCQQSNFKEKLCRKGKEILSMNIKVHSTAIDQIKRDVMTLTEGCGQPGGVHENVNQKRKEKP